MAIPSTIYYTVSSEGLSKHLSLETYLQETIEKNASIKGQREETMYDIEP